MVCPAQIPKRNIQRNRQQQTTTRPNIPRQPSSIRKGLARPSCCGEVFFLNNPTMLYGMDDRGCFDHWIPLLVWRQCFKRYCVSIPQGKASLKSQGNRCHGATLPYMLSGAERPTRWRPLRKTRFNAPQSRRRAWLNSRSGVRTLCLL